MAYALWDRSLRFNPHRPLWPDRDGFVFDVVSAHQGVEDERNVVCLSGNMIGPKLVRERLKIFVHDHVIGVARHEGHLAKVQVLEKRGEP